MIGFIDKELLRKGKNTIEVIKTLGDVKKYNWTIPFYFQPSSGISQ
jgi:archaellum biogenesis ATPase FlaH